MNILTVIPEKATVTIDGDAQMPVINLSTEEAELIGIDPFYNKAKQDYGTNEVIIIIGKPFVEYEYEPVFFVGVGP